MNRAVLSSICVAYLLFSLVVLVAPARVQADSADPIGFTDSMVTVFSPVNMTYNYQGLVLNVSLYSAGNLGSLDPNISMNCSIDGAYYGSVPLMSNGEIHVLTRAVGTALLPELPNGSHYLTLNLYGLNQRTYEPKYLSFANTVYFSIEGNPAPTPTISPTPTLATTANPSATPNPSPSSYAGYTIEPEFTQIAIQSPQPNESYNESSLKLVANVRLIYGTDSTVDGFRPDTLMCSYSVDGGEWTNFTSRNVTSNIASPDINFWNGFLHRLNVTFTSGMKNLTDGPHSVEIRLMSNDSFGEYQDTANVNFTIVPTQSPSPSPTIPEFPAWIIFPILVVATLATLFTSIKLKHNHY